MMLPDITNLPNVIYGTIPFRYQRSSDMANKYNGDGTKVSEIDLLPRTFEPIGNLVILQMVPQDKSPGGIHLPDTVKELGAERTGLEPRRGWVVMHGCQCRYVRRGDLVIVQGTIIHFKHRGNLMACIQETQLVGIERDECWCIPDFTVTDWEHGVVMRKGE